jgi:hypothetical protein
MEYTNKKRSRCLHLFRFLKGFGVKPKQIKKKFRLKFLRFLQNCFSSNEIQIFRKNVQVRACNQTLFLKIIKKSNKVELCLTSGIIVFKRFSQGKLASVKAI